MKNNTHVQGKRTNLYPVLTKGTLIRKDNVFIGELSFRDRKKALIRATLEKDGIHYSIEPSDMSWDMEGISPHNKNKSRDKQPYFIDEECYDEIRGEEVRVSFWVNQDDYSNAKFLNCEINGKTPIWQE